MLFRSVLGDLVQQFRTQMLLDKIAEDANVQVSQDELTQYLIQSAAQ